MGKHRPSPQLIREMREVIDAAKAAAAWPARMLREQEAKLRQLEAALARKGKDDA